MAAIRIAALRESLERLGRFDPVRARARLAAGFVPEFMQHIVVDDQRMGFVTLRPDDDATPKALKLDHLYVLPAFQGRGIGAWVLGWAKAQARVAQRDIAVSALKLSDANRFYLRHGFVAVGESEFDLDYRWVAAQELVA
ncbi:MAG: GNAT family N-acetyltransferase [Burkholderiales bacterium PBB3]|nr:MAG: GNAT family N-acetyltransferase [Burkholderiales bacterium PBB3]